MTRGTDGLKGTPRMKTLNRHIQESDLSAEGKRKVLRNLWSATADEVTILSYLLNIAGASPWTGEILRGAYVRIADKGARYDDWKTLPSVQTRHSSHKSEGEQYHVSGPLTHEILFGRYGGWTWLQLENSPIDSVVGFVRHTVDFVKYKASDRNQGPYGSSRHAEKSQPLILQPSQPYVPIDRKHWAFHQTRYYRVPGRSPFR